MTTPVEEVRIRRVSKLGQKAFEVTVVHGSMFAKEKVCYGRIDDTFVALAHVFADETQPSSAWKAAKEEFPRARRARVRKGLGATCFEHVRDAGAKGVTCREIHTEHRMVPSKSISAALCGLQKRGLVKRVGKRPIHWVRVAEQARG